jgi:glucosamine--fructose-6-phosphate aminotransferase (isomerizing)
LKQVEGAYAVVVSHADHDELVVARMTSPLVLGYGTGETFVASDVPAILKHTRRVSYLLDGQVATLRTDGATATDLDGRPQSLEVDTVTWDLEAAEKGGWPHFMLKEIYEQPQVLVNALSDRLSQAEGDANLNLNLDPSGIDRIVITAAGTASYAGEVGRHLLERWAHIPTTVEVASEFRYANPIVGERTLVIAVSQSGETIDTLEALREGIRRGARSLAILNSKGSSIGREVGDTIDIHAGPEIGVASTKAYVAMVTVFAMLALHLGRARGQLTLEEGQAIVGDLKRLPNLVAEALESRPAIAAAAAQLAEARSVLYLGRGVHVASAKEGALKLKEISYVHAEAFPTGEMKHGPIALIDASVPTVAIATDGPLRQKTASNLQEIKARGGRVFAIATAGAGGLEEAADVRMDVPEVQEALSPVVVAVPLQLLAYEASVALGRDVDQPRNLAKSVTVE